MDFPHLHFINFEQAIRLNDPADESGRRDPIQRLLLQTASRRNNTRWHWEISFSLRAPAAE
jgi:hypothetical protein